MNEKKIINQLKNLFHNDIELPLGDDCAIYKTPKNQLQVLASDQIVSHIHFNIETKAEMVGRKLLARNLSDIASMGARPVYALINVATNFSSQWIIQFHEGLNSFAKKYNIQIIGGDITTVKLKEFFFSSSLTIVGNVDKSYVTRKGAREDNLLYVSGKLGNSFLSDHHLNFKPRLTLGQKLKKVAISMIDISDGLIQDSLELLNDKLSLRIYTKKIPLREQATLKMALTEGEDYELLFSVNKNKKKRDK